MCARGSDGSAAYGLRHSCGCARTPHLLPVSSGHQPPLAPRRRRRRDRLNCGWHQHSARVSRPDSFSHTHSATLVPVFLAKSMWRLLPRGGRPPRPKPCASRSARWLRRWRTPCSKCPVCTRACFLSGRRASNTPTTRQRPLIDLRRDVSRKDGSETQGPPTPPGGK